VSVDVIKSIIDTVLFLLSKSMNLCTYTYINQLITFSLPFCVCAINVTSVDSRSCVLVIE